MPEQRIGTCSECNGSVYGWVGGWWSTEPPPPPKCRDCGAVSVAHDPVIPMRKPRKVNCDDRAAESWPWSVEHWRRFNG